MPKVLFQLYINIKQFNYIKKKANDTGKSRAQIAREAIDLYRQNDLEKAKEKLKK